MCSILTNKNKENTDKDMIVWCGIFVFCSHIFTALCSYDFK